MDTTKFDVILDASDPDFPAKLREALGVKPGEAIEFQTPQFERTDGIVPVHPMFDFAKLPELPAATLKAIGCCRWDEPDENGMELWLYPHQWYNHIPEGTPVTFIDGENGFFKRGDADDDMRFGVLAFGCLRPADPPPPGEQG